MRTFDAGAGSEPDLKGLTLEETRAFMVGLGEPAFRGAQVFSWIHRRCASSFDEMTDLPTGLRARLAACARLTSLALLARTAGGEGAVKYLFGAADGNSVEAVRMRYRHGTSACVSTQVGCKMGCAFCASGMGGFVRDLACGEIVDEVLKMEQDARREGGRVSHVVLMGTGEPLDNYDASIKALRILNAPEGLNVGFRRMTVSTCGLVPGILRLAREGVPVTLSVSLHAPTDDLRTDLMPVNRRYPVSEVVRAASTYAEETGRRVTFEYALIAGVNDSELHANLLAALLRGMLAHVNLIPLNPVEGTGYARPSRDRVVRFLAVLKRAGVPATVRRELGADIDAACGQLRRRYCGRR